MRYIVIHIRIPAALLTFLFLMVSMGFGTMLHTCKMEGMSCCDGMMDQARAETTDTSPARTQLLQHEMTDCCVSIQVPDFDSKAIQAVTPDISAGKKLLSKSFAGPGIDLFIFSNSSDYSPQFLRSTQLPHTAVETYLLTASFLI